MTTATATTTNKSSLFQPLPSTTPPTINGNDVIVRRPVPTHFRSHSNSSFHSFSESSASSNTETTPACTSGSSIHSSRSSSEELSRVLQHVNGDDNVDTIDNSQESRELQQQQQQHPSSFSPILLSPPGGGANSLLSSKPLPSLPMPLMSCPSSSSSLLNHHQQSQQQRKLSSFTVNSKGGSFSIYKKSNNHHFFHRQHQHQQKYEYQPSPQYSPPLYNNINQNHYHHHQQQSLGNNSNNIRRICTPTPHKPIRASPFEPIVKDKQCGKISPLPMHEYEAWIAKRDYERFLLSSSSSSTSSQQQQQQQSEEGKVEKEAENYTFRPVVITPTIFIDNDNDLALLEKSDNTIIQAESLDHHDYNTTTTAKNEPTNDNEHLFSVLHPPHPPSLSLPSHLLFEKQKKRKIDQVAV